jgi:DNA-binding NarL/FixJ family response regulator
MRNFFAFNLASTRPDIAPEQIAGADPEASNFDHFSRAAQAEAISTIVIERRLFVRECLVKLVAGEGGIRAFVSVDDWLASDFIELPDLLFLVSTFHCSEADIVITRLRATCPNCRIVLLSNEVDLGNILCALRRGVHGYISTSMSPDVMVEVLRLVRAGGIFAPAGSLLSAQIPEVDTEIQQVAPFQVDTHLTARQAAVLDVLRQGKSNKVIANELNLCESTVKIHVRNIMKKLHAKNRTEVALRAGSGRQSGNGCWPRNLEGE